MIHAHKSLKGHPILDMTWLKKDSGIWPNYWTIISVIWQNP